VPSRLVAALRSPLALQVVQPPLDPGVDIQVMAYPRRAHTDPASIWLRARVTEIAGQLPEAVGLHAKRTAASRRPARRPAATG
jgi:hypothetical protein